MLIYLKDQTKHLSGHLRYFQSRSVSPYEISQLEEKKHTISIQCSKGIKELSFDFLFNYNIFPKNILTACTQWHNEARAMQIGDTIVQQVCFPPTKLLSQKIIVGVKIKDIFRDDSLTGFSYETLQGHIEKGISFFLVEQVNGFINISIHTYSKANHIILDFLSPLFSSPYQNYCTVRALEHMKELFKTENGIV